MRIVVLSVALCCLAAAVLGDVPVERTAPANQTLVIDQSAMKIAGGKASLIIGPLKRTNDVFGGEFQMKVVPYFFKNDHGTLAITITPDCFAKASKGLPVDISGTATTAGKNGQVRPITAIATPVDDYHGALKLWFNVEDRKMEFETKYRFVEP